VEKILSQIQQYFGNLAVHSLVTDDSFQVLWVNRAASEFVIPLGVGDSLLPVLEDAPTNWQQLLALPQTAFLFDYFGMHMEASVQRISEEPVCYLWHFERMFHPASGKEQEQLLFSQNMIQLLRERIFHIYNNLVPLESELDRLGAYEDAFYLNAITQDCYAMMKNVINSELYAKLSAGTLTPEPVYLLPARDFQMLGLFLQQIFSNTEREITIHCESNGTEPVLYTDWYLLMICILNLLENAVEHTPEEGNIELLLKPMGDRITISVRDDGDGMDPEILSHAMEEMYSYNTGNERVENFGLGLHLCSSIAKLLGGSMMLTSEEFRGTMVTLSLPAAQKPQGKIPFCDELARWGRDKLSPLYSFLAPLGRMKFF